MKLHKISPKKRNSIRKLINPLSFRSKKQLILLTLTIWFNGMVTFGQTTLYVSPSGNGQEFGKEQPGNLLDLPEKLRTLNQREEGVIRVLFYGGEYALSATWHLTEKEAGNELNTIILEGIKGEKVSIYGGQRVTKWQKAGKGIYKAKLPASAEFRQLYVNGKMAIRARTPNRDNDQHFGPYYRVLGFDKQTIWVNASEISAWRDFQEVELVLHQHWFHSRIKLASFEVTGEKALITPLPPTGEYVLQLYPSMMEPGKPYYFENSIEFLDQGGEWYLSKAENTLYYKPRPKEDIHSLEVVYPRVNTLFAINGKGKAPVYNLTLKNLQFAYGNWTLPGKEGVLSNQGVQARGYYGKRGFPGLVQAAFVRNLKIKNCHFTGAGANGIVWNKGVQDSEIVSCHLDQISANGIIIDTYKRHTPPDSLACKNNRIDNNLIENIGLHYTNGMGVIAHFVENLVVESNEIRYGRYTGIQIGNHRGNHLSLLSDNLIRSNNIHHVMQLHDDGGAIYTLSPQPGTKILRNWVHDYGRSPWADDFPVNGIFLDNHSSHILVQDNVLSNFAPDIFRIKEQCADGAETWGNVLINNNTQNQEIISQAGIKGQVGLLDLKEKEAEDSQ
ncbi:right-handed parallel beta-helix repeat-containing protein [Rapidithrix thailandica]|uniref:Right-handed parallel beta-helix repeat-containing protein n=1 Tax=Rapidithrix thailandica TaxID=413964 RepID=A0AAW9SFS6_9BACT